MLRRRNLVVEQILSGRTLELHTYVQAQDEWVVVLAGRAVLEVDGERLALGPGDWLFLPSGVPHTVLETDPGTSWLAVHLHPG
ncbi:MAG: cupin domain-containing protein [Actinomycetota bacterium]|nr:cupin domain-containing protein [Actinomycetota bacterium]